MLVARIASAHHATEAFTWSSTGLLTGVAAGMAAGGWLIERWGSSASLVAAALASFVAGLAAIALRAPD